MGYDANLDPAHHILSHARALSTHPAFFLAGATDPLPERRKEFERMYEAPAFDDDRSLLSSINPDVVIIASPTESHGKVLGDVLQLSSPRMILCEKPLSLSIEEARDMVSGCEERGIPLYVNYPRRSDPGALEIARRIHSGQISLPLKGVAWFSKGIFNNGSHMVNLLEMWLGPCLATSRIPGVLAARDPEPDGFIEFQKGRVALLSASEEHYSHCAIELVSPSGRLRYERGGELITWEADEPDPIFASSRRLANPPEIIPNGRNAYQRHVAVELASALDGKPASLCTGLQALQTLECIHTLLKSQP
jgi:predicted dehydrogenase